MPGARPALESNRSRASEAGAMPSHTPPLSRMRHPRSDARPLRSRRPTGCRRRRGRVARPSRARPEGRPAPGSRIRPSRILTMRSQASPTSLSWVTRMNVCRCSRLDRRSRASTSADRSESRLPVGSSARTRRGRLTRARAIATRCCSPPDSSDGRWRGPVGEPDPVERLDRGGPSRRAAIARIVRREHDVLEGGQGRDQVEVLEDEAHLAGPDPGSVRGR